MPSATTDLEQALRHEQALRGLAARLCRSSADADDAVQHALSQVALGRRPGDVPVLAFLRTALRNCAFNLHKLARRRRRRESMAGSSDRTVAPVDELVAREQLRRRVAGAVLALDEPYRTTVWLRWFEDLEVAGIAANMRVPANTVRTRLQRALVRLRARLDRDYGDRQWAALAAPIGSVATGSVVAATATVGGGIVMKKVVLALVAIAVIVGSTWWVPSRHAGRDSPEALPAVAVVAGAQVNDLEPVREPVTVAEVEAPAPDDTTTAEPVRDPTEEELAAFAADVEPGCIEGIVLRGLQPVEGGRAWLRGMADGGLPWGRPSVWDAAAGVRRSSIDASGLFRFEGLEPDNYAVGVQAPDGSSRHVYFEVPERSAATRRIRIVLGTAAVRGLVFDPLGQLAPSWQVGIWNHGRMVAGTQLILGTTTDASGAFEFTGLCGGSYMLQASPVGNFADERRQDIGLQIVAGEQRRVQVGTPALACEWRGRVLQPRGRALELLLLVELELDVGGLTSRHALDEQGAFQVRVLAGSYRASVRLANGIRVPFGTVEVSGATVRDLVLPNVVRVRSTFVAGAAEPKWPETARAANLSAASGFVSRSARGRDGCEYFVGLAPGEFRLQCWPHPIAGAPPTGIPIVVPAVDELEVDVVLERR